MRILGFSGPLRHGGSARAEKSQCKVAMEKIAKREEAIYRTHCSVGSINVLPPGFNFKSCSSHMPSIVVSKAVT